MNVKYTWEVGFGMPVKALIQSDVMILPFTRQCKSTSIYLPLFTLLFGNAF